MGTVRKPTVTKGEGSYYRRDARHGEGTEEIKKECITTGGDGRKAKWMGALEREEFVTYKDRVHEPNDLVKTAIT
jgi:hypothetical protein